METLEFRHVGKQVNQNFDCGNDAINEYVRTSYYPLILQDAYTFEICRNDIILGYIQIMFRELKLDYFPDDIADLDSSIKDGKLTAVHIRFIAIDKKYQRKKIGTYVLRTILQRVQKLAIQWPIRLVTIDAVENLVPWYEDEGFTKMKRNSPGQDGVTVAMYYACYIFEKELSEYLEQYYE